MDGIIVENISKEYMGLNGVKFHALSNISLSISRGEFISLVGESGSGKSTLSRLIIGLEKPSCGKIFIDGEDTSVWGSRDWRNHRNKIQAVFQDSSGTLNPARSVYHNMEEALVNLTSLSKKQRRDRISELMELTNISENLLNVSVRRLSGGEQRRISLLRAMAVRPDYLILDEVLSGLDLISADAVMSLLERYQREFNCTFLLITHSKESAYRLSDQIFMMQSGHIVRKGIKQKEKGRKI